MQTKQLLCPADPATTAPKTTNTLGLNHKTSAISMSCPARIGRSTSHQAGQQTGSIMLETVIALPVVLLLGLLITQWAFIIQARSMLDHASYMAVRAGALNQGELAPMRRAFARAITPMNLAGTGAQAFETAFLTRSLPAARMHARFKILTPTRAAFADHAQTDHQGRRYLPYQDLDKHPRRPGRRSGVSLQQATRLTLEVTYGLDLLVPFAGPLIIEAAQAADALTGNYDARERLMLANDRLPIRITTQARMQSRLYSTRHLPRQ